MAGIEDARVRWGVIQARGRTRGIIALVLVVVLVLVIALVAQSNAATVLAGVIVGLAVIAAIGVMIGKSKTGLSMTPEWKPEVARDDDYDDDEDEERSIGSVEEDSLEASESSTEGSGEEREPVRRLDAQVLGADLSKLGQVVSPKLAKSYAVGTLVLEGPDIVWEPGTVSRAAGIENLVTAPDQVSVVESTPLWGSWALLRVATAGGDEWCLRVPGSVDLAPAFADLGLTVREVAPA